VAADCASREEEGGVSRDDQRGLQAILIGMLVGWLLYGLVHGRLF
jgi:hypothetical protein